MENVMVVGGGAAGAMASVHLLEAGRDVVLADPGATPGRGVAYSTAQPWHLLNSPVSAMSAGSEHPDDFLAWCRMRCPNTQPSSFVPRAWYGDYLSHTLRRAGNGRLTTYRATVSRIFETSGSGYAVLLSDGTVIPAAQIVLALGNAPPATLFPAQPGYIQDPWKPGALQDIPGDGPVLLIGSGLTAYDVTLSLTRQHSGRRIVAVSRHGLTPQSHGPTSRRRPAIQPASLTTVIRRLRQQMPAGEDWRSVMDAYRPHWNELWHGLSEPDQHRFLRHAARHWEVHRHRAAPQVAAEIQRLRDAGQWLLRTGEVCGLAPDGRGGLIATVRGPGGITTQRFAAVINCTGPGRLVDTSPLVRSLIAEGVIRPGPFRLGLDTDTHGALVRRDGAVNSAMWTLGPPRRGVLWETTAVPEIRQQAEALAGRIGSAHAPGPPRCSGATTAARSSR